MPVYRLIDKLIFPQPHLASAGGILAVGGDLSPDRLILAYSQGIFPWYSDGEPIMWWSPDPRCILFPKDIKISRSMRQEIKKNKFSITYDHCFKEVIEGCRGPRRKKSIGWITDEMVDAYCLLHEMGYAHSVEAWKEDRLAGGLYGVSLGRCFFGESMFTRESNASKTALITLAGVLRKLEFSMIDCQVFTDHLISLGACMIPRNEYLHILDKSLTEPTLCGSWEYIDEFAPSNINRSS
jgi:leucyl/phenylalanyl-tRNA---protein transferase